MTMGIKLGTKTFGQGAEKLTGSANLTSNLSATDMGKLGGESVGEALNKIADPNWVDPSKKLRAVGNDKLDKDAFFKLMLAQMKNQDPTNPLKPHEMSAQLANFSALEQMTNVNQTLQEMAKGQKPTEQFQALGLLGKAVSGDSAKIVRTKGDKEHDVRFTLPSDSAEVEMKIRNSAGEVVRSYDLKNLKAGDNRIAWNGLDEKAMPTTPDEYAVTIEAKGADGRKMAVKTEFEGVISGVNYTPEGPVLMVGNQTIRMRDVRKIVDPSLRKNDQIAQNTTPAELNSAGAAAQTDKESNTGAPEKKAQPNLMQDVALSREMMARVQKESELGE